MEYSIKCYNGTKWVTKVFIVFYDKDFGYMYKLARKNGKLHLGAKPIKNSMLIKWEGKELLLQPSLHL